MLHTQSRQLSCQSKFNKGTATADDAFWIFLPAIVPTRPLSQTTPWLARLTLAFATGSRQQTTNLTGLVWIKRRRRVHLLVPVLLMVEKVI